VPTSNYFFKSNRLLNKNDFQNLRVGSRFLVCGIFIFYFKKNDFNESRLGIAVTKKFGKANKRNRIKRKIRDFFRNSDCKLNGFDILVAMNTKKIKRDKLDFKAVDNLVFESLESAVNKQLF
jgi:ribonuclease P protein component